MAKDELITSQDLPQALYESIRQVLSTARAQAARAVNWTMVEAYWQIGRLIVEEEQQGKSRAEYGTRLIETLAERLVKEFGGVREAEFAVLSTILPDFPESARTACRIKLDPLPGTDAGQRRAGPAVVPQGSRRAGLELPGTSPANQCAVLRAATGQSVQCGRETGRRR